MSDSRRQERLRDLLDVGCETLGDAQSKDCGMRKKKEDVRTERRAIFTCTESTTVHKCGDNNVPGNESINITRWYKTFRNTLAVFRKHCVHDEKEKKAHPVAPIDDYMKHIFQTHNPEADHLARRAEKVHD